MKNMNLEESKHNQRHEDRYKIDSDAQKIPKSAFKNFTICKTELDILS